MIFSNTFYPTPRSLAHQMIAPWKESLEGAFVLDPSAGKGDLLDAVHDYCDYKGSFHLYAIEIVPDLRSILEGNDYIVLAEDFLTYTPRIHFTHIVMNPPFDHAEDHLLKAWNMLYEGEIVCVMPATSLEGKTIKERTILEIIQDHGSRENVGCPFKNAERPTKVECEIVRLKKCANGEKLDWEVRNDREQPTWKDAGESQELALQGFVTNLLASFNAAMAHYEAYNAARQKILVYLQPFDTYSKSVLEVGDEQKSSAARYNAFTVELQNQAWARILDHPGFQSILTERARNMMQEFRAKQKRMDFNEANIMAMLEALMLKKNDILTGAVLDAFDTMTKFHEENRVYYEGWKSNKAWKVNHKVVLPYYVNFDYGSFHINYASIESLCDIDRAMCVVANIAYDDIQTCRAALEMAFRHSKGPGITESSFFEIRFYKKGTIHLRFLDATLWQKFNYLAAKGRNWLPPGEAPDKVKCPVCEWEMPASEAIVSNNTLFCSQACADTCLEKENELYCS